MKPLRSLATLGLSISLLCGCTVPVGSDASPANAPPMNGSPPAVTCATGRTICGGTCVDEQTDYENCGGCGLRCSAGCVAGRCTTILASGTGVSTPAALAVDATRVYWTDPGLGDIAAVPLSGGGVVSLSSDEEGLGVIGIDAAHVYWSRTTANTTSLMMMPLGGGAESDLLDLPGLTQIITTEGVVLALSPRWVEQVSPSAPANVMPLASGIAAPLGAMAFGSSELFWARNESAPGANDGAVLTQLHDVEQLTSLATGVGECGGLAIGPDSVYWTDSAQGLVMKVPMAGGTPTTIASHQATPKYIAADASGVYWTNTGDDTVMKLPGTSGTPETIAKGAGPISAMVIDATSIYWTALPQTAGETMGMVMKTTPK